MAKAVSTATTFYLTRKFEEVALFQTVHKGGRFYAGLIDGEFTVEFDQAGEWIISDVDLKVDNGLTGPHADARVIALDADDDERFYLLALDALERRYGDTIPLWIDDELANVNLLRVA